MAGVFLGDGDAHFSMTPNAAALTLQNLRDALADLPTPVLPKTRATPKPIIVLVVEDEAAVRKVAVAMLEDAGYAALQADGPRQALLVLETRDDIAVMFTDVLMPGDMNGLQLAVTCRRRWPSVQLLITSGYHPVAPEDLPAGGRFIRKPYLAAEVLRHVGALTAA